MKKIILVFSFLGLFSAFSFGQLIDEKNVTVTMDLQPILQLNMTTSDQVDFVFDDIRDYYGGIIKYAATILKVSSSVSWDLYAVGTSQAGVIWDQQMTYSTSANPSSQNDLPLSLLELHQYEANQNDGIAPPITDYSSIFQPTMTAVPVMGQNSIYNSASPYTAPAPGEKYINGISGTAANEGGEGGSYLTEVPAAGSFSEFYYTIDYRIVPSLPATFPFAGTNAGTPDINAIASPKYAEPGVYTMNCKYVLLEDQ